MSRSTWAASGRRREPQSAPFTGAGWELALSRARQAWDSLTGGPAFEGHHYTDAAAAAILTLALALWRDSSAMLEDQPENR